MRPILALNCLLQIEQERSEEVKVQKDCLWKQNHTKLESSVGYALALHGFCSAFLVHFASYSRAPVHSDPTTLLVC